MVTGCPRAFAKSARFTPTPFHHAGGLLWNFHVSTPLVPATSTMTAMCGLNQSTFVRVPVTVMNLAWSNTADTEWWPQTEGCVDRIARSHATRCNVLLMCHLRCGAGGTQAVRPGGSIAPANGQRALPRRAVDRAVVK